MINRKALGICITVALAMTAAAIWRLSLLPDWQHMPVEGPGSHHTVTGLTLLIGPAMLLFGVVVIFVREWMIRGPEESLRPWQRWNGLLIVSFGLVLAVLQAFLITRSTGFVPAEYGGTVDNGLAFLMGILLIVLGNAMPKLPWLSSRFRALHLDPWQRTRHLRMMGKVYVGLGLILAVGMILLPREIVLFVVLCLWLTGMAASIMYRIKLRREPSPLP